MHLGLAEWSRTQNRDAACNAITEGWPDGMPVDDYRTLDKALTVMTEYTKRYPSGSEPFTFIQGATGPFIEVPFCLPLNAWLDCVNPDCGDRTPMSVATTGEGQCFTCGEPCEPIEYGGILDGAITHSGQSLVWENKTTSQLGAYYFKQFRPNGQCSGYLWGAENLSGNPFTGVYINAIGAYKVGATKFERYPTSHTPEEIAEWRLGVIAKCNAIARAKRSEHFPMSPKSCTLYAGCEFHSVCEMPLVADRARVLETHYHLNPWDFEKEDR